MLTATLLKRLEQVFLAAACLPPDTPIIRAYCDQPQISYMKLSYDTMTTDAHCLVIDVAKILTKCIGTDHIGVIFCGSKDEVERLGRDFTKGCISHSGLSTGQKHHNEAQWKAGHKQWIAATTGLIHGIDSKNVGAVIFRGVTYGLLNLYQGSG